MFVEHNTHKKNMKKKRRKKKKCTIMNYERQIDDGRKKKVNALMYCTCSFFRCAHRNFNLMKRENVEMYSSTEQNYVPIDAKPNRKW